MLRCHLLGHRPRFESDGTLMRWRCERCGAAGQKRYESAEQAARYAASFDREDRAELGSKAPLGAFPLRILHAVRRGRAPRSRC